MLALRKADERGHFDHGWLNTFHSFSFADYFDPKNMGFRSLRVINEDKVQPGEGFGTHGHNDMEIITYVLEGTLEHKDSMGNGSLIKPGEVQYMSAGSGVTHSEFNASKTDWVHLLQIWILPNEKNAVPRYDQKDFSAEILKPGKLCLAASPDGASGSIAIRQDAKIWIGRVTADLTATHQLDSDRFGWLQMSRGVMTINGKKIKAGDGVAITHETDLKFECPKTEGPRKPAEFILFDLG